MLFDKCGNCKYYKPKIIYKRAIFSKKPKEKNARYGGECTTRYDAFNNVLSVKIDCWCKNYERKGR